MVSRFNVYNYEKKAVHHKNMSTASQSRWSLPWIATAASSVLLAAFLKITGDKSADHLHHLQPLMKEMLISTQKAMRELMELVQHKEQLIEESLNREAELRKHFSDTIHETSVELSMYRETFGELTKALKEQARQVEQLEAARAESLKQAEHKNTLTDDYEARLTALDAALQKESATAQSLESEREAAHEQVQATQRLL